MKNLIAVTFLVLLFSLFASNANAEQYSTEDRQDEEVAVQNLEALAAGFPLDYDTFSDVISKLCYMMWIVKGNGDTCARILPGVCAPFLAPGVHPEAYKKCIEYGLLVCAGQANTIFGTICNRWLFPID